MKKFRQRNRQGGTKANHNNTMQAVTRQVSMMTLAEMNAVVTQAKGEGMRLLAYLTKVGIPQKPFVNHLRNLKTGSNRPLNWGSRRQRALAHPTKRVAIRGITTLQDLTRSDHTLYVCGIETPVHTLLASPGAILYNRLETGAVEAEYHGTM